MLRSFIYTCFIKSHMQKNLIYKIHVYVIYRGLSFPNILLLKCLAPFILVWEVIVLELEQI